MACVNAVGWSTQGEGSITPMGKRVVAFVCMRTSHFPSRSGLVTHVGRHLTRCMFPRS